MVSKKKERKNKRATRLTKKRVSRSHGKKHRGGEGEMESNDIIESAPSEPEKGGFMKRMADFWNWITGKKEGSSPTNGEIPEPLENPEEEPGELVEEPGELVEEPEETMEESKEPEETMEESKEPVEPVKPMEETNEPVKPTEETNESVPPLSPSLATKPPGNMGGSKKKTKRTRKTKKQRKQPKKVHF